MLSPEISYLTTLRIRHRSSYSSTLRKIYKRAFQACSAWEYKHRRYMRSLTLWSAKSKSSLYVYSIAWFIPSKCNVYAAAEKNTRVVVNAPKT